MKLSKKKRAPVLSICMALIIISVIGAFIVFTMHDKYGYFKDETPLVEENEEIQNNENATLQECSVFYQ